MTLQNQKKKERIKYDKKDKKLYIRTAVVFSILAVMNLCILNYSDEMRHFPVELEAVFVYEILPFFILAARLWLGYINAVLYLKRLQKYGYEVPEDKKNFNEDLEKLPMTENAVKSLPRRNYDSIVLTVLTGAIVIGLLVYDIWFLYRYSGFGNDIWFFEGILIFGTVIWLLLGISYARQISNRKYKYDVEIDHSRKNRRNLIDGLVGIIVLLVFTFPSIEMINNAVQYMTKAREGR